MGDDGGGYGNKGRNAIMFSGRKRAAYGKGV